jgi:predicted DNA-binding protein
MDELVVNAAFEKHMTKASWIRKAIRHNLGIAGQSANATSANTPGVR